MGPNYDPAVVDQLRPGMTKAEVIALLGKPTSTASLTSGEQQVMWVHSKGTMLGRADARAVMLQFDASGRYSRMLSQSETNIR